MVDKGGARAASVRTVPRLSRCSTRFFTAPADATPSTLDADLVASFAYPHTVASQLSSGSVRDLKNALLWLREAEQDGGEVRGAVTMRVKRWMVGVGEMEDPLFP